MPRKLPVAFYSESGEPCENCGKDCESRTWVPGFDYWGCDDCAAEARIVVFAEANCPTLYNAVMRSKTVGEVQRAFRQHQESCPKCNPKLEPIRLPEAA